MAGDLLPCPFCGGDASDRLIHGMLLFRCDRCGADGPVGHTIDDAVKGWNRRTPSAALTRQAENARALHLASVTTLTSLIEALAPLVRLDPEGNAEDWTRAIRRRVEEIGKPAPVVLTEAEMDARWRAWTQRKNRLDRIATLRTPQSRDAHDEEERAAAIAMHEAVAEQLARFALTGVR